MAAARALLVALLAAGAFPAGARAQPADQRPTSELLAAGDAAWEAERHDDALAAYSIVVARDSAASSRAVFRAATLLAYRSRFDESVRLFRLYMRLEPDDLDGPIALGRTLAWASRFDEAIAVYDAASARDPASPGAALGRAQALAWAGKLDAAIAAYERWLAAHPSDRDADLALARALSWAGRLADAERRYARLAAGGASPDAEKGFARVLGWRGDLGASRERWRELTVKYPRDPEAWTGLAQVLRWSGQNAQAREALLQALALSPGYSDAREQLRWVEAELAPSLEPAVIHSSDSDDNRGTMASLTAGVTPWWRGRAHATVMHRVADAPGQRGSATAGRLGAAWSPVSGRWTLRAEAGAERLTAAGDAAATTVPLFALRVAGQPAATLALGAGVSRSPFDETATLIARGIEITAVDVDASLTLRPRLTLAGTVGHGTVSGGRVPNSRTAGSGTLRWLVWRGVSLAAGARTFAYERPSFVRDAGGDIVARDGYFAPQRYALLEASGRYERGGDLGWHVSAEGGLGRQTIRIEEARAASRFAQRLALTAGYRVAPGIEVGASFGFANVASPSTAGTAEYRATTFALRGRLKL